MRKEYVTFISPGTFMSEYTTRAIATRDVAEAVLMSQRVVERYNARPFAFYFSTMSEHAPIPDGEGGTLNVEPKEVDRSGNYFLGGVLLTLDELKARHDSSLRILIDNMESNGWPVVIENCNSWKSVQPFKEKDCVVDERGNIVRRGDEPELVEYRKQKIAERKAELAKMKS